jgi:hypothetical protein
MNWFNVVHKRFDRNEAVAIIFVWRAAHGVAKCGMHPSTLKYLCCTSTTTTTTTTTTT